MKVRILVFGKNKDDYISQAIADFERKLRPFCQLEIHYVKDEKIVDDIPKVLAKEAETLERYFDSGDYLVVLDERGKSFSSSDLAKHLERARDKGSGRLTFVIGSAHGLSATVKARADLLLSLSPLTMSHQLVRPVLLEQLYRIFTIQRGMKYHK